MRRLEADANRSADTHLHTFPLPEEWGIDLYLKDESVHPTGSLKHRLARSLFLYGLCNGWITERTTIVEASSGSTAVSEAYFARFLGLPFIAVMPASTSPEKIALIEAQGGHVPPGRRPDDGVRRGAAARDRARRVLPRPVHLRGARDRLARQQQHRRVDLQPDGPGAPPRPRVDRGRRGNRRDERDDRPLRPLRPLPDADVRRRPGGLDLLLGLDWRRVGVHRPAVAHRGHRTPAASSRRFCPTSSTG